MTKAPTIETDRLTLRSFVSEDVDDFAAVLADKEAMWDIWAIAGVPDNPTDLAALLMKATIKSWNLSGFGEWAVCTKSPALGKSSRLIGFVGFVPEEFLSFDPADALEVGWGIAREFWGLGLASEASRAAIDYGFNVSSANKMVAITDPKNTASRRLMERLGFSYSDVIAAYGVPDQVLYSLARERWER